MLSTILIAFYSVDNDLTTDKDPMLTLLDDKLFLARDQASRLIFSNKDIFHY